MKSLIFDIETDGLQPTKIYCMSVLDVDSQEQTNFKQGNIEEGIELLESADKLIGHNIMSRQIGLYITIFCSFWYEPIYGLG